MTLMSGITNAQQALAAEDLQGHQFKVVGAQVELNVDPASPVAVTSSAAGLKFTATAADVQTVITGVGFPTAPPPVTSTDWVYLDTSKNTVTAIWDSVAGAWVQAGKGIWDKDLNTGITVEEGANDNAIRAYIGGVASGVTNNAVTGWGFQANSGNSGTNATGIGVAANFQNSGANTTGVGVAANSGNSGGDATGIGVQANQQNSGTNVTGVGVAANFQNSGTNVTGIGVAANFQNSGTNATGIGVQANQQNSGGDATGVGVQANFQNSGTNVTGAGVQANFQNSGTNVTGVGTYANQQNSGTNVTGVGVQANFQNSGTNVTGVGTYANQQNSGTNNAGFGAYAIRLQRGSRNTAVGVNTFNIFETFEIAVADVNVAANTITMPAHTFGVALDKFALEFPPGSTPPAPLSAGTSYVFQVVDANTVKPVFETITAAPSGPFAANTAVPRNNCSALGEGANPDKHNQVMLGGPGTTDIKTPATNIVFGILPEFAMPALADVALQPGQLYTITGDRTVYQRP